MLSVILEFSEALAMPSTILTFSLVLLYSFQKKKGHLVQYLKVLSFVLLATASFMGAENRFVGTWKMIPSESKFSANAACQSETVKVEADGRVTVNQVDSTGKELSWSHGPANADATRQIQGLEEGSTVRSSHTNTTLTETFNWNGWHMTGHGVLSKDGKRMTYTLTGTDNKGKPFKDVMIFEKQQ